ncbi:cytochrome D ubiquinol oxidase subunit I [Thiohalorhabdus denitrificans]|uniref:Cytochrome d ubiquinol oxidase subunit I n=1 Tax=Thiohalorhabdus denitrificans TaxID=381306 RepID=A0A0P9CQ27_9GAMM|nr:cytochrome ubiquinol oxidase subunit I [Thiohalorhabdus denitrificans]KPV41222.1 cytochrome D ubiquinol oxidase subunit I [Thiohalorhabdus denitrificans]SCY63860.1 cytochrome d ubiquinol oxidase subunit I [Thiohalorhabdus denitrificans]
MLDALMLSRIQFGFVVSFHILFPALTIGLACWLAFLQAAYFRTREQVYLDLYFFWLKIFALSFGMGVVSGIVMSFQFGTNWSRLTDAAGNILGPLLSYEVLTAFFLEATFLGVMLFGWRRVSPRLHFFSTCMVALGTLISAFWILSANSWMHSPAGYALEDGVFMPVDWFEIVFNPSFPYRFVHMVLAAFLATAFFVGGVSAWYLRRGRHREESLRMLKLATAFTALVVPAQIVAGDLHGLFVVEHQPAKLAAMEGHWETQRGAPLVLAAWPDEKAEENHYEVAIPKLASLILKHDLDGEVTGLKAFAPEDRPPVQPVFWSFRIMVALGVLMLVVAWGSAWAAWRGRLERATRLQRAWVLMAPSGLVAILMGWYTTEIGRQPWVIQGLLRTSDAHSAIDPVSVAVSLTVFVLVYFVVFGAGIWYMLRLIRGGIRRPAPEAPRGAPGRPLSASNDTPEEG